MNYREKATGRIVQAAKGWQDERGGVVVHHPDQWVVLGGGGITLREESAFMAAYEPANDLSCSVCGLRVEDSPASGPQTFEEGLGLVLDDMRELMIAKQRDYGPGNILDFGDQGVLVRANDKIARLKNLYRTGDAPQNETVDDSWIDLGNYAVIAMMVRRGHWGLPMEAKLDA